MKRLVMVAFVFICLFTIVGCSQKTKGAQLLKKGNVVNISVSSLPEEYNYIFNSEDSKKIIDYISDLNLESKFEEDPNVYTGMTWVISIKYDDNETLTLYHFGNMFIRSENGSWFKMNYDEASRLDTLLNELNK